MRALSLALLIGLVGVPNLARAGRWISDGAIRSSRANALAVHPTVPRIVYVGTEGLLKSDDGAASWFAPSTHDPAFALPASLFVNVIAIDERSPSTVWVGTNDGLFRSTDDGVRWQDVTPQLSAPADRNVHTLTIDAKTQGFSRVFVAVGSGGELFRSVDGASFEPIGLGAPPESTIVVDPNDPRTVYLAAFGDAMFRSSAGGDTGTWTGIASPGMSAGVAALVIDPRTSVLYAGVVASGVYRSADRGDSWQSISAGLPVSLLSELALALAPGNPPTLYLGTYAALDPGLYRSTDAATWAPFTAGLEQFDNIFALAVDRVHPTRVYAGNHSARVYAFAECPDSFVDRGEQCDEGPTTATPGSCCTAACQIRGVGALCRDSGGLCDQPETCNGMDPSCPPAETTPCSTTTTTSPPAGGTATTTTPLGATPTTTLPTQACPTARDCLLRVDKGALCEGTIGGKLGKLIDANVSRAVQLLDRAAKATSGNKVARLAGKARTKLQAIETKAYKFVTAKKRPISTACRDQIIQALAPGIQRLDQSLF
jgi:hypothetical protein